MSYDPVRVTIEIASSVLNNYYLPGSCLLGAERVLPLSSVLGAADVRTEIGAVTTELARSGE